MGGESHPKVPFFFISKFIWGISFRKKYQQKHGLWSIHTTLDAKNRSPSEDQVFFWGWVAPLDRRLARSWRLYALHRQFRHSLTETIWGSFFLGILGEVIIINRNPNEIFRREAAKRRHVKFLEVNNIHLYWEKHYSSKVICFISKMFSKDDSEWCFSQ